MINFNFNDGGRAAAGYKGFTDDCVCRAICIATGLPYKQVYERLANGNASQRRGKGESKYKVRSKTAARGINTKRKWFEDYLNELGFKWVPTMKIGEGCKVHLSEKELPKGRLIINVSKHFTTVIDGTLNDTHDCSRSGTRCVYGYYIYKQ